MSAIGDLLINLGQSLPATLRKRQEEEEAQARQDKRDSLSVAVSNAQLGEITRKNSAEDAATLRATQARTAVGDTLSKISSGDFRNPDTQIEDPELVKEQAITAATAPNSPYGNAPVPALFNGPAAPSAGAAMQANQDTLNTVGLGGLAKAKTDIQNRSPAEFFRGQTGAYSDQPVQKEVMSDFEKQAELKQKADETAAQRTADQAQHDKDLQTNFLNQKTLKGMEIQGQKDVAGIKEKNNGTSNGGALRGPGATALRIMQGNSDWKTQNAKVSTAVHGMTLFDQATDPKTGEINLNQIQSPEMAMTVANLISGTNSHTVEEFRAMTPQAYQSAWQDLMSKVTGKPTAHLTQAWAQSLKETLARQGLAAENLRSNSGYQDGAVEAVTAGINVSDEDKAKILDALKNYGPKFSQLYPNAISGGTNATGASKTSSGNRFTWQ